MKGVKTLVLLESIFAVTLIVSMSSYHVAFVSATSGTPTYVLGVSNPTDPLVLDLQSLSSSVTILPGVSSLSLVGGNSILVVDGSWLALVSSLDPTVLSLLQQKVLSGVPTVAIRGNPGLLDGSLSGLFQVKLPDLPLLANGMRVVGTLADGTILGSTLLVVAGFDYAVQAEFHWAEGQLSQTSSPSILAPAGRVALSSSSVPANTTGISWRFIAGATFDTGDQFAPMGRVVSTVSIFRLENSGTLSYRWFNLFVNQTIIPGIVSFGSTWRVSNEHDHFFPNDSTSELLVGHGPNGNFTSASSSSVSYSIGVNAGFSGAVVNASQTKSYSISHTTVTDLSNATDVIINHDIDQRTNAGKLVFQIIPGTTLRVVQNQSISITGFFTTTFEKLMGSSVVDTKSPTFSFQAFGG
jgi:hypothetical protein